VTFQRYNAKIGAHLRPPLFHSSKLTEPFSLQQKVKVAGGKQASEIEPESDMGLMQHFEDTEGNYFGIYMVKPKEAETDK
jgi:hypothetical protein